MKGLVRRLGLVATFLLLVDFNRAAPPPSPVEQFKSFLSDPPALLDLICDFEFPGVQTNYYRIRWQSECLLFGQLKPELKGVWNDFTEYDQYVQLLSRFKKTYWFRNFESFYSWEDTGKEEEKDNSVLYTYNAFSNGQVSTILNLGCGLFPVGSIHWDGNTFSVTNEQKLIWGKGQIFVAPDGRVSKMVVRMGGLEVGKRNEQGVWSYEYAYNTDPGAAYIPSRIRATFVEPGKKPFQLAYVVQKISLTNTLMGKEYFRLDPTFFSTNRVLYGVSNNLIVYQDASGHQVTALDRPAIQPGRTRAVVAYLVLALLVASIFPVYMAVKRKHT